MKTPWKLSAGLLIIAMAGAGLFGCGDSKSASDEQGTTVEVQRGVLLSTVNAIGSISMPHQTNLTFGSSGTVNDVKVSFGDKVKAGDVLAQLDTASLERAVTQAEANLRTAQINLDKAKQPYTAGDIAKAQAVVESAKAALAAAQDALDNPYSAADIAKSQATVDSAAANLASARQDLQNTKDSLLATAQLALDNAQRSLTAAQSSSNNSITNAENSLTIAQNAYNTYVQANIANLTRADIAAQVNTLSDNILIAQNNLDVAKSGAATLMANDQNLLQSAQTTLAQAQNNPPIIQQKQSAVADAQATLDKAREDLAAMKDDPIAAQQRKSQVATAQAALAKAQEDLATIEAGPDTQDIDLKQIQVDNAQVALDDVKEQLDRATIVAPFDGVVASVGATAGDQVPVNTNTVIVVLVDTTKAEVDATVDEIDVAKVKAGQMASIALDAIENAVLRGTVTAVSPIAQTQSGVVTYKLAIAIESGPPSGGSPVGRPPLGSSGGRPDMAIQNPLGYDLKAGMTASANIIVLNKPDVLLVPSSTITRSGRDSVVQVLAADGTTEQRVVQKGATDGTQTEIVSGLSEGEKVVITTATAVTSSQNSGMFRMFGPGGPPPGGGDGRPPG